MKSTVFSARRSDCCRVGCTQPTEVRAGAPAPGTPDLGTGAPALPGLGDHRPIAHFATYIILVSTICLLTVGCEKLTTQIEIVSFEQERLGAEQFVESFPDGSYTRDAYKNVNITFEIPPTLVTVERPATPAERAAMSSTNDNDPEATEEVVVRANTTMVEADDAPTNDDAIDDIPMVEEQVYIAQMLHIEMLWQPRPGKTYAERTQTDAGITYCLQRGGDRARYEGAGFVYFTLEDDGRTIVGEIESATLYPAGATDESVAVLGPCRIRGPFVATLSANGVMSVKRRIRSEFAGLDERR